MARNVGKLTTKIRVEVHSGTEKDKTPHVVRVYFECDACGGSLAQGAGDTFCRHCGAELMYYKEDVRE